MNWKVAAFYRFTALEDIPALRADIEAFCRAHNIWGTILLAPEGVNATIAGPPPEMDKTVDYLDRLLGIRQGELKFSGADEKPFQRLKVRPKKEIITMKAPEADPVKHVGTYVAAKDWNDLLSDPDVVVLDTRNDYETKAGLFKGALDPNIQTFSQFTTFVESNLDPQKHKKIAMYCTGGIRCEKASSFMLAKGFSEVYHLKGGILKYLEDVPKEKSLWQGSCFVFDERGALLHGLEEDKQWVRS